MGQSKVAGAAGEGALPDLVPLGVEDELGIGGRAGPRAPGRFAFAVARAPARLAGPPPAFPWPLLGADARPGLPASGPGSAARLGGATATQSVAAANTMRASLAVDALPSAVIASEAKQSCADVPGRIEIASSLRASQ